MSLGNLHVFYNKCIPLLDFFGSLSVTIVLGSPPACVSYITAVMYMHANYLHLSKLTAVFEVSLAIKVPWILIRERERERERERAGKLNRVKPTLRYLESPVFLFSCVVHVPVYSSSGTHTVDPLLSEHLGTHPCSYK